jgi:AHBA synthesis associated protein
VAIQAVVFDLDGVLVDSIEVMQEAFQRAYNEVVGPGEAPFEEYLRHLGRHMPDSLALMGLPATMYEPFVRFSRDMVHHIPACEGAGPLLDELCEAGLALAVATGKVRSRAEQVLAAVGLLGKLDTVIGSDEVTHGKPAPDMVTLALERLGVAPANAVMVGDAPLDLVAGRAAGTLVAAALWGQGSRAELLALQPDLVAASCGELGAMLGKLAHEGTGA